MFLWRKRHRPRNGEKGQSLVEFAMVLPIFIMLVFAIIDFGAALFNDVTLNNAVREGARRGAVQASEDDIKARVQDTADPLIECSLGEPVVSNAQGERGDAVTVEASCEYPFITPLPDLLNLITFGAFPDSISISSSADMRLE